MNSASATRRDYLSSFGRNRGRSLSAHQQRLVDELLPQLKPSLLRRVAPRSDEYKQFTLEIGFGAGEHLAAQARHHPETLYLGSEPYINGVAKLLAVIDREKLTNIRIDTRDVRELLKELPSASLDEIFILFPDPWPKARHHKRRLINYETLALLARLHKPGGRLLIATDHADYAAWILEHLSQSQDYAWLAESAADWQTPPSDWTETKYQRKTSGEGRQPMFFECRHQPRV
ncbi:MAG: tRNA (guanosine(46)-N7)-methyltransferase TrmB [Alphaproteobacteria bacterium]